MAYSKTYTRINWQNAPSEATALNETNLNKMDSAIDTLDDRIVTLDTQRVNDESAISTAQGDISSLQSDKVDKVAGKGLSTNDYTDTEKNKLATIQPYAMTVSYSPNYSSGEKIGTLTLTNPNGESTKSIYAPKPVNYLDSSSEQAVQNKVITNALANKVDKVENKGLFTYSDMQFADDTSQTGDVVAEVTFTTQDPLDPQMVFPIYNGMEAITNAEIDALA